MKWRIVTFVLCVISTFPSIFCANILGLFPYNGKSHFDFFHPLFLGLANAGHDVTVVSYFPNKKPVANYTDLVLEGLPVMVNSVDLRQIEKMHFWFGEIKLVDFFVLNYMLLSACEEAFKSKAIKDVLESGKKFDVILTENFVNDCMLAISYQLKAPVIGLTSHAIMPWHYKRMGSPFLSSFMPNHFLGHSDQMRFLQRLNNMFHHSLFTILHEVMCQRATNRLIRKHFGNTVPPIQDLVLNTSAMLVNQHFALNGATPYAPSIVEVGGLHIQQPKPLDTEIKELLDNAKNGVIFVSWGSLVQPETLPIEKKNALINALSKFDQLILLKWPNTSIPDAPSNFYLRDWMPQRDILCHPNVKVFMTHGGLLGTTEGCYCGVSLVMTPFFGDQFLNAKAVESRKAGVVLHYRKLNEENIVKAIQTALSPSMQQQAKFISEAYRNRPQKPLDLAIWWVEHIIRLKGAKLAVNASSEMCWFTYHNLDIYAVLLISILLLLRVLKCLVITKFCFKKKAVKQKAQ